MLIYFSRFKLTARTFCLLVILPVGLIANSRVSAQSFSSPSELCLEEQFSLSNESVNAESYFWDFCEGDLQAENLQVNSLSDASFSTPLGFDVIESGGKWYGFVGNAGTHKLSRLDFGESLLNPAPTVVDLGNPGELLKAPQDLKVVEHEGAYYGFVYNNSSNQLVRLSFGSGLENTAVNAEVVLTGSGMGNGGIEVVFDGKGWYVFLTKRYTLTIVRLGSSPANLPQTEDVYTTAAIPGVDVIGDIRLIEQGGSWFGFIVGANSKTLHRLSFGSALFSEPQGEEISGGQLSPYSLYNLEVEKDKGQWLIFSNALQGNLLRMTLGEDLLAGQLSLTDLGNFSSLENNVKLSLYRQSSRWLGVTSSWKTGRVYLMEFPQGVCGFDQEYSTEAGPISLKAQQTGAHAITLYGQSSNGVVGSLTKAIQVTENQAPQVSIQNTNCLSKPITLTTENLTTTQTITSYTWTFPDDSQQTTAEASYQFAEPGTYTVRLDVESENGCGNFFEKEVVVYPEPQAAYTVSEALVCTNAAVSFTNGTVIEQGAPVTYSWDFGDGTTSAEASPQHEFAEPGTYTVTLSASIPGCSSTSTQTVEVQAGPQTLFAAANVCDGATVAFDNQTTGQNITGYNWDLGDGTFSTLENPEHIYDAPGEYTVVLRSANELGCETSYTQNIRVYSLPEPDFTNSPACEGNTVQFTDATTDTDGNLIAWNWEFEMPDGTTLSSNEQNPEVTYNQPGSYQVSLTATTTWNCTQTLQKTIVVDPMPEVVIGFDGACAGELGTISDITHTGGFAVQSWYWLVGDELFTDSTFSYHFAEAGTYEVFLQLNLENGCSVQGTKQITIEPLPVVDFAFSGACVGQTASFEALTPSTEYVWTIEGKRIVSDGPVLHHAFASEGTYAVQLTVFDERGCSNTLGKELVVGQPPVAAFSADRLRGVPPFTVHFTNQSEGSVAWRWLFGDAQQSSSSLESPSFTFTEIGDYSVQLISYNEAGCADTVSQVVSVLDPKYDVALTSLHKISKDKQMQLVLGLENKGTIQVYNMEIEISINNEYLLNELFTDTLEIGEQRNYPLSVVLNEQGSRKLEFVCIRLKPRLSLVPEELSVLNNEKCLNFNQAFIMQAPHPNPASDDLMLSFVLPDSGGSVVFELYTAQGALVQKGELKDMKPGFNQHGLDISGLGKGVYHVRCRYGAEQRSYRILKN